MIVGNSKMFNRPKELGTLMVVGGPGGSGSSTIAKLLHKHFNLKYYYGGALMREIADEAGFSRFIEFLNSEDFKANQKQYDKKVDNKLARMSMQKDVLIDSKNFAALATFRQIPCTYKIWLHANLHTRVRRTLHKTGVASLDHEVKRYDEMYIQTRRDLGDRYKIDKRRYKLLYGIEYDNYHKYNDVVLDTSNLDVPATMKLILKRIRNGAGE